MKSVHFWNDLASGTSCHDIFSYFSNFPDDMFFVGHEHITTSKRINASTHQRINASTHQRINASTHQRIIHINASYTSTHH
jgi:hypothetical protein